jgi:competence protein ComEC
VRTASGALVPGAVVGGIFLGEALGPSAATTALFATVICVVGVIGLRDPRTRVALALLALVFAGCSVERRALDGLVRWPLASAAEQRADVVVRGTLVEDPDGTRWSTRVLVRVDDARLVEDARAFVAVHRTVLVDAEADATGRVAVLRAGDGVVLRGYVRPLDEFETRLRWRHAVAAVTATDVLDASPPSSPLAQVANAARGFVLRGTDALPPTERALVAGFLLGDTRDLPDPVVRQFRDAGLSHLLAVSGANVAFVLALFGPALRRLPRAGRLAAVLALLLVFGAMTRWEPSVLRACAMATVAVLAVHLGRPAQTVRLLGLAVAALLLVDPFLVHSVGFLLSVGASLGIALFAAPLARRCRGPEWLRESLGTTAAAQLGVAPVLVPVFGSIPLVAVPANLLAVPLAGPLTMWGLAAGSVAGMLRTRVPALATALQWPTRVLADAVLGLADAAARVPVAVGPALIGAGVGVGLVAAAVAASVRRRRMLRRRALVLPSR